MLKEVAIAILLTAIGSSLAFAADARDPSKSLLAGIWSFDESCASGDGMGLKPDGTAWYDESNMGMWAEADGGKRLVLILQTIDPVDNSPDDVLLKEMRVESLDEKRLKGTFDDGREVDALRCPQE